MCAGPADVQEGETTSAVAGGHAGEGKSALVAFDFVFDFPAGVAASLAEAGGLLVRGFLVGLS